MTNKRFDYLQVIYTCIMALLAVISVVLIIMDFAGKISLTTAPYFWVDNAILVIFAIDYFTRLLVAKNKWQFIRSNIFDLLSIIPVYNLFGIFRVVRISRLFRLFRLLRLFRLVGLIGRLEEFLKMNGLIYYIYISLAVIMITSAMYCVSEKVSFTTALWWSITTSTTVGYGDISPQTGLGKIAAVVDMLIGIGLIGMLTSSISSIFAKPQENETTQQLKRLREENKILEKKLNSIEELLQKRVSESSDENE